MVPPYISRLHLYIFNAPSNNSFSKRLLKNIKRVQSKFFLKSDRTAIHWFHFQPLDVMGRGNETQLQVGENANYPMPRFKRLYIYHQTHVVACN